MDKCVFVFRFADEKLEAEGVVFLVTAHVNLASYFFFFDMKTFVCNLGDTNATKYFRIK